ncbi:hypothetical protein KY290_038296 [Solanum tuberosum]|uniref:Retrotransposon gag domain-containing protein n=1 Tax=Solanum tuberosum TaxID=4113 RepID=A0ABQ7TZR5_SOLTU|nr:hypothetical protein KY290_038296 [Solanum tuberosum]
MPLLGSALPPNVGLPGVNPDLFELQCGYRTPDLGITANRSNMVNTRSSTSQENTPYLKYFAQQLSVIASKLNTIDSLATEVATLKAQNGCTQEGETTHRTRNGGKSIWREEEEDINRPMWKKNPSRRPHTMMEFPRFEGGDPRGWILKAEKYFCYYQTLEEHKVDIAAMYPEADALDLFSWINRERTLLYWKEIVKALQENYGPVEFQNPNEHLCSIQQKGSIQEYRQEFAQFSSRLTHGDQFEDVDWVNATTAGESKETNIAEISFHAILGQSIGSTMKLQGEINHRKVLILVDRGSTHNFVVKSIVEKHKLPVEIVPTFTVQIGNGDIICRN